MLGVSVTFAFVVFGMWGCRPTSLFDAARRLKDFSADAESRAIQHKLLHGQAFRSVQRSQSLDYSMLVPV